MKKIEIRQNRNKLIPMLILLTIFLLAMIYYVFFYQTSGNIIMKTVYSVMSIFLIYAIYIPTRKFLKNEPVLTFSDFEIEINEKNKPITFSWRQITAWKIEKDEDTYFLFIETAETKKKVNISWLDKDPGEIENLLTEYKVMKQ